MAKMTMSATVKAQAMSLKLSRLRLVSDGNQPLPTWRIRVEHRNGKSYESIRGLGVAGVVAHEILSRTTMVREHV